MKERLSQVQCNFLNVNEIDRYVVSNAGVGSEAARHEEESSAERRTCTLDVYVQEIFHHARHASHGLESSSGCLRRDPRTRPMSSISLACLSADSE